MPIRKGHTAQNDLSKRETALKKDISDHRDYQIAHEKVPEPCTATLFDAEGNTKIFSIRFYPTDRDNRLKRRNYDKLIAVFGCISGSVYENDRCQSRKTKLELVQQSRHSAVS